MFLKILFRILNLTISGSAASLFILFICISFLQSTAQAAATNAAKPVAKGPVGAPPDPSTVATTTATQAGTCAPGVLCAGTPFVPPCSTTSSLGTTTGIGAPCTAPLVIAPAVAPPAAAPAAGGGMPPMPGMGGGGGGGQNSGLGSESASGGSYYGGGDRGGGNFNQSYDTPAVADSKSPGSCNDAPSQAALDAYNQPACKAKTQNGAAKNAFVVDADSERAWVINKDGTAANAKCFVVTIGAASRATIRKHVASFGEGKDQTPSGLLITTTKAHSNVFQQGDYTAMKGLDDSNSRTFERGVYLHPWHQGGTQGCIGIKDYHTVRDLLGYNGAPVFVYGKNMQGNGCGGASAGSSAGGSNNTGGTKTQ